MCRPRYPCISFAIISTLHCSPRRGFSFDSGAWARVACVRCWTSMTGRGTYREMSQWLVGLGQQRQASGVGCRKTPRETQSILSRSLQSPGVLKLWKTSRPRSARSHYPAANNELFETSQCLASQWLGMLFSERCLEKFVTLCTIRSKSAF